MPFRSIALVAMPLLGMAITSPAFAFDASLSHAQVSQAVQAGQHEAQSTKHGFTVKQYVLFGVKDPLSITPGEGEVDAVIVGTPREMLRYRSYLASFQNEPLSRRRRTRSPPSSTTPSTSPSSRMPPPASPRTRTS